MLSAQFVALYKPCKPKPKPKAGANSCVAELRAGLLELGRQDWDSFIYI